MSRKRDYKAEYDARKRKEVERGFSSPSQAQRARRAGKAAPIRTSQRQVYRKGQKVTVTTTKHGKGLGVVGRTLDELETDLTITVYADMRTTEGSHVVTRQWTVNATAEALQGLQGDELKAAVADLVTEYATGSGTHKRPGAPVPVFTAADVVRFQVAW